MLAIGGDAAPAGSGGDDGACGSPYEPVPPPSRAPPLELVLSFDIALRSDDDTGAPRLGGATEVAPAAIAARCCCSAVVRWAGTWLSTQRNKRRAVVIKERGCARVPVFLALRRREKIK